MAQTQPAVLSYRQTAGPTEAASTPDVGDEDKKFSFASEGSPSGQQQGQHPSTFDLEGGTADVPTLEYQSARDGVNPLNRRSDYPSLDYSSFSAFKTSLWARLKAIFTKRFVLCLLWGQVRCHTLLLLLWLSVSSQC